jgi:hypothetical protein
MPMARPATSSPLTPASIRASPTAAASVAARRRTATR